MTPSSSKSKSRSDLSSHTIQRVVKCYQANAPTKWEHRLNATPLPSIISQYYVVDEMTKELKAGMYMHSHVRSAITLSNQ